MEPVEDKDGSDEEGVAVAEVVGGATVVGLARGAGLILPVDVHEEEKAEGDDGEEGHEEGMGVFWVHHLK